MKTIITCLFVFLMLTTKSIANTSEIWVTTNADGTVVLQCSEEKKAKLFSSPDLEEIKEKQFVSDDYWSFECFVSFYGPLFCSEVYGFDKPFKVVITSEISDELKDFIYVSDHYSTDEFPNNLAKIKKFGNRILATGGLTQ